MPTLKAMVINCDGLKGEGKKLAFQSTIKAHSPDIIFGCESKIDPTIPSYSIFPEEYSFMRKDRNKDGGGVFIAMKDAFVSVEHTKGDAPCEIIWTSMEFVRTSKAFLGSFYRTSSDPIDPINHLYDSLTKIMDKNTKAIQILSYVGTSTSQT